MPVQQLVAPPQTRQPPAAAVGVAARVALSPSRPTTTVTGRAAAVPTLRRCRQYRWHPPPPSMMMMMMTVAWLAAVGHREDDGRHDGHPSSSAWLATCHGRCGCCAEAAAISPRVTALALASALAWWVLLAWLWLWLWWVVRCLPRRVLWSGGVVPTQPLAGAGPVFRPLAPPRPRPKRDERGRGWRRGVVRQGVVWVLRAAPRLTEAECAQSSGGVVCVWTPALVVQRWSCARRQTGGRAS